MQSLSSKYEVDNNSKDASFWNKITKLLDIPYIIFYLE